MRELTTNDKGRHAELLAATALLANGWIVMEPLAVEPFDLAVRRAGERETYYVQVKMAFERDEERFNGKYVVVRGVKDNGKVYTLDEVDLFAAVWRGEVYLLPNREITEYWIRPWLIAEKWERLNPKI